MISVCMDFDRVFGRHAVRMLDICRKIYALPNVGKVVLFGSYARGEADDESDIDLAVFFDCKDVRLLEQYRQLARICVNPVMDVQIQPFHSYELATPCGIIEEIEAYGLELRPL